MSVRLSETDIDDAIVGGMLLSAGGSGRSREAEFRGFAERALRAGPVELTPADALPADAGVLIATAVGAPGGGKHLADPEHSIAAARQLLQDAGRSAQAVMPGHVPGFYAWLLAAELGLPLLDAACNGRGHPTVKMGSLGLSSRPEVRFHQCGVGDKLRLSVHANTLLGSQLMRAAAVQNGGLIMGCRGPFDAALVREAGAAGAISFQLALGRAARRAGAQAGAALREAIAFSRGRLLVDGRVVRNDVAYREGFDVGQVVVADAGSGAETVLGVCNEWMTAEVGARRVATFPDLLASMDPDSGTPLAIGELVPGARVAVFAVSKRDLPLGRGIFDPSVYPDVERSMDTELARYALDPAA
ncbi:MAG: DUF917 family protein [Burkholderiaceae bacterium]